MAIQSIKRIHVSSGRLFIRYAADRTVAIGMKGERGTLNGRLSAGLEDLKIMMPVPTMTNAKSVPILTSSPRRLIGTNPARIATIVPVMAVVICGVWYLGWIFAA